MAPETMVAEVAQKTVLKNQKRVEIHAARAGNTAQGQRVKQAEKAVSRAEHDSEAKPSQ
jgi:hypothetical protein